MKLYRDERPKPGLTLLPAISFTFGIIHVHSHPVPSSIPRANGVVKICLFVPSLNGETFGRFDSAVRISFPLPSYPIFTLTPAPADPNRLLLLSWALHSHPRVTLGSSDHLQARTVP